MTAHPPARAVTTHRSVPHLKPVRKTKEIHLIRGCQGEGVWPRFRSALTSVDGGLAGCLSNPDFGDRRRQRFARATAPTGLSERCRQSRRLGTGSMGGRENSEFKPLGGSFDRALRSPSSCRRPGTRANFDQSARECTSSEPDWRRGVDSNPRCREGFLWAEFGPCLGHYLARPKASAPKRVCSPRIRLCFSSLRHQSATRCSAASIEFSLVDRSKFTRTSLTASLIEKPGLAPVFNTKVIGECLRWVPFWILNLAGSLESSVQ
jgi:hypothetical protein